MSVEKPPPAPRATRPTPTNEIPAAAQNARDSRSSPTTVARMPMKIGVIPRISATVDALVSLTEYTKQSWLRKISAAAAAISLESRQLTANERSRAYVNAQKRLVAAK